jgi:hypothetical protein
MIEKMTRTEFSDALRVAVREFVVHYHRERNHQGVGNVLLFPEIGLVDRAGPVRCSSGLGGLSIIMSGSHDVPGVPVSGHYERNSARAQVHAEIRNGNK